MRLGVGYPREGLAVNPSNVQKVVQRNAPLIESF
jgi:hypothetical protein